MFNKGIKAYNDVGVSTAVNTANPLQLIVLLYDGAMTAVATAKGEIERQNIQEKSKLIIKALAIIGGLRGAVDLKNGGEIAANLDNLYQYMQMQLTNANMKNDTALLDEVHRLLGELRSSWEVLATNQGVSLPMAASY